MAFIQGDKKESQQAERDLKHKTKLAKFCYKNKMEERFTRKNVSQHRAQRPDEIQCPDPASFP